MFWPQLLGIDVRPARLIRGLQRSYAVPGREQFTAALDLAQTTVSLFEIDFHYHPYILIVMFELFTYFLIYESGQSNNSVRFLSQI